MTIFNYFVPLTLYVITPEEYYLRTLSPVVIVVIVVVVAAAAVVVRMREHRPC